MQCSNCNKQTQEGVAFCHYCGTPMSAPATPPLPPTVAAPQPLHTSYNPSSNNPAGNPYGNPSDPYANPPSPHAPPPPPSNFPPYPQPGTAPAYGATPAYPPGYGAPVKRKSNAGLIVGIVITVIVVGIIGVAILPNLTKKTDQPKATTTSIVTTGTSTPTTTSGSPSGTPVDSTAASIVTNLQMASDVDQDTAEPTKLTTSFDKNSTIYVTFQYNLNGTDVSTQKPAYMQAKWYRNNKVILTSKTLNFDGTDDKEGTEGRAIFGVQYYMASKGSVEVYWCRQADCSDAKLAQYTTFTVS